MSEYFSPETKLFVQEYDLVREMERIWQDDSDRVFAALLERLNKNREEEIAEKTTQGYRYWWSSAWKLETNGGLELWCPQYDPDLLRKKRLEWHVYANLSKARREWANMKLHDAASSLATPAIPRLLMSPGPQPKAYKAVRLEIRWETDPVEDCFEPLEEALQRLGAAWERIHPTLPTD